MKNPIKYSVKSEILPIIILLATIIVSVWAYPQLPSQVISHWSFNGTPDGWSSREFYSIFFPGLLIVMYGLFSLMPRFDPKSERYTEFSKVYLMMRTAILSVLFVIFTAATLVNLGYNINIGGVTAGVIGLLMMTLGNYLGKLKRNYFIGIRTPWTLSSDNVWNKTHRLGGRLFMIWGVCLIFCPWVAQVMASLFLFGGLIAILAWVSIYSYTLYKKEKKN